MDPDFIRILDQKVCRSSSNGNHIYKKQMIMVGFTKQIDFVYFISMY
jgi:hypothetical protein